MVKGEQLYEEEFKAGALLKLKQALDWHNGYFIDHDGRLGKEFHLNRGEVVMYLETQINLFQPEVKRYKCLFGDRFVLINGECLRAA